MEESIKVILDKYIEEVMRLYGESLKRVILYGSYARGDVTPDSDIDVMILVDLETTEIKNMGHKLSDVTFDVNFDYDVMIMPIVQNEGFFERWVAAYPFYNNVNNEGIELYAA